jgi:hypothetical protein
MLIFLRSLTIKTDVMVTITNQQSPELDLVGKKRRVGRRNREREREREREKREREGKQKEAIPVYCT